MKVSPDAVKLRATDVLLSVTQHDVASIREFLLHQVCVGGWGGGGSCMCVWGVWGVDPSLTFVSLTT